ncbi:MAG: Crp/Fnr family transcriptional regulator [bacterium]
MFFLNGVFFDDKETAKKARILARTRPFENCNSRELKMVARLARFQDMEENETLVQKGEEGKGLYVLENGQVSVRFKKDGPVVAKIGAGNFFGEMSLLDEKPRTAWVRCDAAGRLLFLSRQDFFGLLSKNSDLAAKILFALGRTLSDRLRQTNKQLEEKIK